MALTIRRMEEKLLRGAIEELKSRYSAYPSQLDPKDEKESKMIQPRSRVYEALVRKKFELDLLDRKWYVDINPFLGGGPDELDMHTPDMVIFRDGLVIVTETKQINEKSEGTKMGTFFTQVNGYRDYYEQRFAEPDVRFVSVLVTNSDTIVNSGSYQSFKGIVVLFNPDNWDQDALKMLEEGIKELDRTGGPVLVR
ncbi:MAG TPA: hypothetical protein VGK23_07460 [Methanomassiliicoccales archaeon]|jgi:hypothetical protein